jgi:hypothetical protein
MQFALAKARLGSLDMHEGPSIALGTCSRAACIFSRCRGQDRHFLVSHISAELQAPEERADAREIRA